MKRATRTGFFFLGMVLFYIIAEVLIVLCLPKAILSTNLSYILGQMLIVIPGVIYILVTKGDAVKCIPFKKIKIENALILVIFAYVCIPVVSFLNMISMLFTTNYVAQSVDSIQNNLFIVNVIMIAVMPAVFEEITFRGIIFNGLRGNGIFSAVIVSGCLFGLFHMNLNQFIYAFIMGCVFALINEASGSILGSMIIHFVFNLQTVLSLEMMKLLPYLQKMAGASEKELSKVSVSASQDTFASMPLKEKMIMFAIYGVAAIGCTILNIVIFRWYSKRTGKSEHIKEIFKDKASGFTNKVDGRTISIPLIAGVAICIAVMILNI